MIAAMLLSLIVQVNDATPYRNLGFSSDGRYFAFAETGVWLGTTYANGGIIEVATNRFVVRKSISGEGFSEGQALRMIMQQLDLGRFNIVAGQNRGIDLYVEPADGNARQQPVAFTFDLPKAGTTAAGPTRYEAVLQAKRAVSRNAGECTFGPNEEPKMFRLSIVGRDGTSRKSQILQDDKTLPASRGCVSSYGIHRITTFRDAIVVILNHWTPVWEVGYRQGIMAVTGKINFRD